MNKVTFERKRKQALLEGNPNDKNYTKYVKDLDILLIEKQFQETIRHHKQTLEFMN